MLFRSVLLSDNPQGSRVGFQAVFCLRGDRLRRDEFHDVVRAVSVLFGNAGMAIHAGDLAFCFWVDGVSMKT